MVEVGNKVQVIYTTTGEVTYIAGNQMEIDSNYRFNLDSSGLQVTVLADPLPSIKGSVIKNVHTEDGCYIPYAVLVYDRWYGLCKPDGIATSVHGDDITEWEPIEDED